MLGRARTGDGGRVAGDLVMVFGPQRDLARARVPAKYQIVAVTLERSVQARSMVLRPSIFLEYRRSTCLRGMRAEQGDRNLNWLP